MFEQMWGAEGGPLGRLVRSLERQKTLGGNEMGGAWYTCE